MAVNWFDSPATFRKGTVAKVSFILLCLADLALTTLAISLGFTELNPLMGYLLGVPVLLMLVKLAIPVLIAWLIPGKLLMPSIALLGLAFLWNIKEMAAFLVS